MDATKTSLVGHGGLLSLANYGGDDNVSFETAVTWRSPELELNDIGFMNIADQIDFATWVGYRFPKPFSIFRRLNVNMNHYHRYTFGGESLYHAINANVNSNLTNFWNVSTGIIVEFKDISTKSLFGGPKLRKSSGFANWLSIGTDSRKKIRLNLNINQFVAMGKDKGSLHVFNINPFLFYQPTNAASFTVGPGYFRQNRVIQNINYATHNGADRYITGRIIQETFSFQVRLNYSLTPNLTLEYWGRPFISRGQYTDYKYISDPLAPDFDDRFVLYTDEQWSVDEFNTVLVDEDLDQVTDYSFRDPDFNFLQFRSNMVVRWEYIPGSEFFLVWSQGTTNSGDPEKGILDSLNDDLFGGSTDNILLAKFTYRWVR